MSEASKVYEIFEEHKDFFEKNVPAGIEKNRKGDGKIILKDKNGAPIKGAKIKINQKSHEFRFGANLFMLDELETEEKNEKYKKWQRSPSIGAISSPKRVSKDMRRTALKFIDAPQPIFASNFARSTALSRESMLLPTSSGSRDGSQARAPRL